METPNNKKMQEWVKKQSIAELIVLSEQLNEILESLCELEHSLETDEMIKDMGIDLYKGDFE